MYSVLQVVLDSVCGSCCFFFLEVRNGNESAKESNLRESEWE